MTEKNNTNIKISEVSAFGFEKNKQFYLFKLLAMWSLTLWVGLKKVIFGQKLKTNTFWFDGASPVCRRIKEGAFSWRALDIIYNYSCPQPSNFEERLTNFWNGSLNAQAARNRLRMVRYYLGSIMERFSREKDKEVRVVSIASGSAAGVIEEVRGLKKLKKEKEKIRAMLIDLDPTAIEYSRGLAGKAEVSDRMVFVNKSTTFLEEIVEDFRPHIVEMVGFLEYRPDDKAVKLLERIRKILLPGGVLITSQIAPNAERLFLYTVINWPMVYRTPSQFSEILTRAGFSPDKCSIIYEPLKIHGLAICEKP